MRRISFLVLVVLVACSAHPAPPTSASAIPPTPSSRIVAATPRHFDAEIAALADVDASGVGYSPTMSGDEFLPDPRATQQGAMLLGQSEPRPSPALTRLVEAGADAVPALLACLETRTRTKLPPMRALEWQATNDEYDVNRRTTPQPPKTNRDGPPEASAAYVVTVGDLCFVALGQIVNRSFAAVRYQPSGGIIISSPSTSAALRDAARAEWGKLDRNALRASLARDFREPDHADRRKGALVRLAYYAPDDVKPLLDAELARPTYDPIAISGFVRDLYRKSPADRARAFALFVTGPATRDGVEQSLFGDLDTQEAWEQKRINPATTGADYRARECLVAFFGRPPTVKATDKPFATYSSKYDRERLLEAR